MDALLDLISSPPPKATVKEVSGEPKTILYSGSVIGVRSETLSRFAVKLTDIIPDAEAVDVQQLENLAILEPDRRYSSEWDKVVPKEIVKIIADTTRDSGQEELVAFA